MSGFSSKRIMVAAALVVVSVGTASLTTSMAHAQAIDAPKQEQPAQSLEAILSEVRSTFSKTDTMLLVIKLHEFIKSAKPDLGPLIRNIENSESDVERSVLLMTLQMNAEQAVPALPLLVKIAKQDSSENLRSIAVMAIGDMGQRAESAVGDLQTIVGNKNDSALMRVYAANALGGIGPRATVAYDDVFKLFLENDDLVGGEMLGAVLGQFDGDKSREGAMLDLLAKTEKSSVRVGVVNYLLSGQKGLSGQKEISERAAGTLIDALLKEDSKDGAETIAWALEKAHVLPPGGVEKLMQELGQTQSYKEIASITRYLRNARALTQPALLDAYSAHLKEMTYGESGSTLSEIAGSLAETRNPKAVAIVFEAMRQCPDKLTCQMLGSSLERGAPFAREMLMEMLSLFRTTKNEELRDQLFTLLGTADSTFLPVLNEARDDALYKEGNTRIGSQLELISLKIRVREKKAGGGERP